MIRLKLSLDEALMIQQALVDHEDVLDGLHGQVHDKILEMARCHRLQDKIDKVVEKAILR